MAFDAPITAYVALGANLGDREANVRTALRALAVIGGIEVVRVSSLLENPAVGGPPDSPDFLNGVAELRTTLDPHALLRQLLDVERRMGRSRRERWEPRPIDLDLLLYGDWVIKTDDLTLPHPRMHERRFVLRPLAELAPGLVHPALGRSVAALLRDLPGRAGAAAPTVEVPPIDVDLPCAACGYNLRGLSVAGRCPECGAPVIESARDAEANDLGLYERLRRSLAKALAARLGYPADAVMFVADACTYSTRGDTAGTGRPPPLDAAGACRAVRHFAATYFHSPGEAVELLTAWGIARGEDVGRIVVALAGAGWIDAAPGMSEGDFAGQFVTAELFRGSK